MKKLDKFIYFIFSVLILVMIVIAVLLMQGIIDMSVFKPIEKFVNKSQDIVFVIFVILGLFAIKGIFFQPRAEKAQRGILLENKNGKLLIATATLENLANDVAKDLPGVDSTNTKIEINKNNNLVVKVKTVVSKDAVIKQVTKILQEQIKEAIKQASDLEIDEVNVDITKISNRKMKQAEIDALSQGMTIQEYNEFIEEKREEAKKQEQEEKEKAKQEEKEEK